MATHRMPILGWSSVPDTTGECWFEQSHVVFGSNDLVRNMLLRLGSNNAAQPTVKHGAYGSFLVPKNYVGSAVIVIEWSATLTSGDVVFDFDYRGVGGSDAESLDQATWQESVTVTDTAPTTARNKLDVTVNLTSANLAVDDVVQYFFGRDGVSGSDTMAGSAWVTELEFQFADT